MRARAVLLAALLAACTEVDLDGLVFACATDDDCTRGLVCDPVTLTCAAPDSLTDAGAPPDDPDAGPPDAGPEPPRSRCFPPRESIGPQVDAWWCVGMAGFEVSQLHARGGELTHLSVEAVIDRQPYYAASFARTDRATLPWVDNGIGVDVEAAARSGRLYGLDPFYIDGIRRWAAVVRPRFESRTERWEPRVTNARSAIDAAIAESNTPTLIRIGDLDYYQRNDAWDLSVLLTHDLPYRITGYQLDHAAADVARLLELQTPITIAWSPLSDDLVTRLSLTWMARSPTDLAHRVVYDLDAEALDREVRTSSSTVFRIEPYLRAGRRTYAAILVETPRTTDARVRSLIGTTTDGITGYLARRQEPTLGRTITSTIGADSVTRTHDPATALAALLVLAAHDLIAARTLSADASVPIFATDSAGCPTEVLTGQETFLEAATTLARTGDRSRARSVYRHIGARRMSIFTVGLAIPSVRLSDSLGCQARAQWSLRDAARIWEAIATRGRHPLLDALGSADALGVETRLRDAVARECARASVTCDGFLAQWRGRALSGSVVASEVANRAVAGVVELPSCLGGRVEHQPVAFAAFIERGTGDDATAELVRTVLARLLRDPTRTAVEAWRCR